MDMAQKIERAKEVAEINILREEVMRLDGLLQNICNGIANGEHVPLTLADGSTVLITKAKPRRGT